MKDQNRELEKRNRQLESGRNHQQNEEAMIMEENQKERLERKAMELFELGMRIHLVEAISDEKAFNNGGYMICDSENVPLAGYKPCPFSFSMDDLEGYISDCIALQTKWAVNNNIARKLKEISPKKQMMVSNGGNEVYLCDITEMEKGCFALKVEDYPEFMNGWDLDGGDGKSIRMTVDESGLVVIRKGDSSPA
jgi:hypothetical protein